LVKTKLKFVNYKAKILSF